MSGPLTIGDYAIIGDCRSAALVSRNGSVDWLCWPRFDSPSLFAALLDRRKGGRFAVCPAETFTAGRRYVGDTNVLETTFRTARGVARLTDLMPVASESEKRASLQPDHQILRRIECLEGEVEIEVVCDPRPNYALRTTRLRDRGVLGFYYEHRGTVLILRSDLPLTLSNDRADACGRITLRAGERRYVSLVFGEGEPAVIPPLGEEAERKIRRSLEWWERWAARCSYDGPHRPAVLRSALALKLMTYAPSGAVVAAPTTSLPESIGGERNWDYRYCWLRDASLTLRSLFDLGYREEARAFMSWLLYTTRPTWPEIGILYDVHGETHVPERTLDHLDGFAQSRRVRVGNDARHQLQLDVYGEVLDAVYEFVRRGGRLDRQTARLLVGLGKTVCRHWRDPDEGIWEIRAGRRYHTYSKVMCWVALDRLLRLDAEHELKAPVRRLARERDAIRDAVERHGYNESLRSYVATLGGDTVDASLLLLGRYGYASGELPGADGRCGRRRPHVGTPADLRERPPPLRRGNRSPLRRSPRKLPPGIHPRGPDRRRPHPGRTDGPRRTRRHAETHGRSPVNWPNIAQGLGLSRMSIPFMLGTMFTGDRSRAAFLGFLIHLMTGWAFALVYGATFESLGRATWWLGAAIGLIHAAAVLVAIMPVLPGLHPRMASEHRGPEPTRALEPPGFLALNYGRWTPIVATSAHLIYGALLGGLYRPAV